MHRPVFAWPPLETLCKNIVRTLALTYLNLCYTTPSNRQARRDHCKVRIIV